MKKRLTSPFETRSAGFLLHPTSLPGKERTGDFGGAEFAIEFARATGLTWWQMLPVHPPDGFGSPYQSHSSFAGSIELIPLDDLVLEGWLSRKSLAGIRKHAAQDGRTLRERALRSAFEEFEVSVPREFTTYKRRQRHWLEDWCLFRALSDERQQARWQDWEPELRDREDKALRTAAKRLAGERRFHAFCQFAFDRSFARLRDKAGAIGLKLLGDVPKFVAKESADAWVHRDLFHLTSRGELAREAGTPPDHFTKHGQRWGVPTYRVAAHRKSAYSWWRARIARELEWFDALRLDHFIGYVRTFSIPAKRNAPGRYEKGLGAGLFRALHKELGGLPFVGEDLGNSGVDVERMLEQFQIPGTRVLQFGLDGLNGENPYLPHNWPRNSVAYTGTHDNPTTEGWFRKHRTRGEHFPLRKDIQRYTGESSGGFTQAALRTLWTSVANTVIVPFQDLLGLGAEARMNVPGRARGNWSWRLQEDDVVRASDAEFTRELRSLTEMTGRLTHR